MSPDTVSFLNVSTRFYLSVDAVRNIAILYSRSPTMLKLNNKTTGRSLIFLGWMLFVAGGGGVGGGGSGRPIRTRVCGVGLTEQWEGRWMQLTCCNGRRRMVSSSQLHCARRRAGVDL